MTNRTLAAALSALLAGVALPAQAFELTILHTNDVHDRFEPINASDSACSQEQAAANECFGGVARLATALSQRTAAAANPLVLDAGDWFQGTLFFTQYGGEAAAEMINRLGYHAMAVGNHEFDNGPADLEAFANALDIPLLGANIDPANEPALADGSIEGSTIVEVGGERIGVIGVVAEDTPELATTGEVAFERPAVAIRREVERLEGEGVNKIVLLSHVGYELDKRLAAEIEGIDVIVGGHSQTLLSNDDEDAGGAYPTMVAGPSGAEVPIVQAYSYTKYLGELTVTFDEEGVVTAASGDPILLDASFDEDPEIVARVVELAEPLEEIRARVVASAAGPIDGSRETCRIQECEMGNLVADAMLERTQGQGVQVVIINGGGLRASIDEGEVTQGEILTVLPFLNTLSTFEVSGADLVAALENGVGQVEDGAGRFPQVAGLQYEWTRAAEPGSRIREVRVKDGEEWVAIDPAATYLVASNNFMRNGGDGYDSFVTADNAYDFGPTIDTVVVEYLAAHSGGYEPYTDGRITEVE
ncbi:bifunctional metallophosphatase/5'-nucleotidase [Aureimonas populi]|uniref:Bifunctional metallophosphatase/5'-nucleotidase n=1 Tax=Aureimonas populi TaxID=1701758 RepID=A0ABW5CNJ2_9HYPH|nr:bifunctional metallophosphatase/5'-nucleotidase [Aureimonas populi]